MRIEFLPVLDTMLALYRQARGMERFQSYLKALQGDTNGDLALPIGGFNPMAKEHVLYKLESLQGLNIENIIAETVAQPAISAALQEVAAPPMRVAFNLADDVAGGWTNRYTTDYDSRFRIGALVKRGFITPMFWTSEVISRQLIQSRTSAACFRTAYWLSHGQPQTLHEHLAQEAYAMTGKQDRAAISPLTNLTNEQAQCTEPSFIFNVLYGDEASAALGYRAFGFADGVLACEFDLAAS